MMSMRVYDNDMLESRPTLISEDEHGLAVAMIGSKGLSVCHSGLEAHVRELASQLGLMGCRVSVYGWRNHGFDLIHREYLPETGVEDKEGFHLKGKLTATISNSVWATVDAIRSGQIDIVHYHGVGCVFGLLLARKLGFPTVLSLHSTNWQENKWSAISQFIIHWLERLAVHAADVVIVVSQSLANRVRTEYNVLPSIISNEIRIKGRPERDHETLQSLGLEKGKFVLYVGRIVPDKGCHVLVEALHKADIPMKLALIGPHQDKAYAKSISAGNRELVIAPGTLQDQELGALYRSCWAFCSASVSEGQSRVLLEALAHGCTCLVSDIPGHRELVTDPDMRFSAGDVAGLCGKLLDLYQPQEYARVRNHSRWLEQHPEYWAETTAKQVMDVYREVKSLKRK